MVCAAACAQDTRTVTEPAFPTACAVLKAELKGPIALADETKLDTARVQGAIDHCAPGNAVKLVSDGGKDAFLIAPIQLKTGVTLLVDKGVTVYGSRDPRAYETSLGSCGKVDDKRGGCRPLISAAHAPGIGIMGDGVIDGRGGAKLLVDGKEWTKSWWDLANEARAGGNQEVPRLITTEACDNFTLYRITLKNSAQFHVVPHHSNGVTVWGLKIDTPATARNTDGFDPSASTNITVTQSYIRDGDDNIAIKGGDGPVTNMSVVHNHFYYGHGMSIGSETVGGVSNILVSDLSLDGTTSGIRIKSNASRGGLVHDVTYQNVCIRNSHAPIDISTAYTAAGTLEGTKLPVFRDITLRNVRISGGGTILLNAYDATHRVGIRFDNVLFTDSPSSYKYKVNHADITFGPGPSNLEPVGADSTVNGTAKPGKAESCAAMFVPFPAQ